MTPLKSATAVLPVGVLILLLALPGFAQPAFEWALKFGVGGNDHGFGIKTDAAGNVYSSGTFGGTVDFDPGPGIANLNSAAGTIFILKLDPDGNFIWAKQIGGAGGTGSPNSLAIDLSGNLYVTGAFAGTADFDPSAGGVFTLTPNNTAGFTDAFVASLDASGNFRWAVNVGGASHDLGAGISAGGGTVYVTGSFTGPVDFDPSVAGSTVLNSVASGVDAFVLTFDLDGNFRWAAAMGGSGSDRGNAIHYDALGNVYTTGGFANTADFDPSASTFNLTGPSFMNAFISKLDVNGNFVWAKGVIGTDVTAGWSIKYVNSSGSLYVLGYFLLNVDLDPGAGIQTATSAGNEDIFLVALDASGNLSWAKTWGGSDSEIPTSLTTDPAGNIYSTGNFHGTTDFDPGVGVVSSTAIGISDAFISRLDPSGNYLWAGKFGGNLGDAGNAIAIDPSGNILTTGAFSGSGDFDPGPGVFNLTSSLFDIFVQKLGPFASTTCVPAAERTALEAIYSSTNGAGWSDNSNWLSADESTWFGVTITGCHVTALYLNENNLVGPLPAALGDLVHLTELDLSFNDLTGNLPSSSSNLTALELLHLDHNQISGPIPSFLGSFSNLLSIDLSHNQFDGFIPVTLGNLSSLSFLSLAVNELDGEIPTELGGLSNLEVLDLSSNLLYGQIPVELGDLSSLISLKLGSNLLDGGIPPELGNIPSLLELNLEQNRLDGVIPGDLGNLTNLHVLFLGNNLLVGAVPFELGPMPALEEVSLVHNSFTSIPTFTSTNITQLAVEDNYLNFGDLEPNAAVPGYTYDPQALLPPGGVIQFIVGGTVFIPFGTAGTANSYQWFKDGSIIPGATSATYAKSGAVVGDVGLYAVHVTNSICPDATLISEVFTVITDPCVGVPRASGQLDTSFDAHLDNPTNPNEIALQSTGKIIASLPDTFISPVEVMGIVRFNTDGSLDNTFNSSSDVPDEGQLLVQSDDKIVYFYASEIHRLNADGTDDAAFNTNAPSYYNSTVYALAQQPDGKILIAVSEDGNLFVDRINTDGTDDATFTSPTDLEVSVIRVQSDGKIILGGYFFGGIMRLNADGSYDSPFNENSADEGILDIAIQPDGKIIAIGLFNYFNGLPRRGIVRLNTDGSIDDGFTAIGITDQIEFYNHATRIALQGDGKIILAGFFDTVNGADRKNLVRLNSDGTVDCPFNPGLSTDEIIDNMIIQADGKVLIAGDFSTYDGTTRNGFARVITGGAILTITQQPADAVVCVGTNGTFTTNASGTTNITFRWQFSATGNPGTFADISDGANYFGTGTTTLNVVTTASFGQGRYQCRINGDGAPEVLTNDEGLFINPLPPAPGATGNSGCSPASLLLTATGGSPGQYVWYTTAIGIIPLAINATYTTTPLTVTTTYYVAIKNSNCQSNFTPVVATVLTGPAAPTTTGASSCGPGALALTASGGTNGQYRWYRIDGTPVIGEVNNTFTTPSLTTTTGYMVAINDGTCESSRTPVVATINTIPAAPTVTDGTSCGPSNTVVLNASGGSAGQYRWYSVAGGGTAITGAVSSAFTTAALTTTTTFYVAINNGPCESSRTAVVANIVFCNQPPVIAAASATVPVAGSTTITLLSLISDPDNNLDLSTLSIVSSPTSGAIASIVNGVLSVNYAGIAFAGPDQLTIRVCDVVGACVQRVITIDVTGEVIVYNGISPNGDNDNDKWIIQYIDLIPDTRENKVSIFNRWGDEVFATDNYDNQNRVFTGVGKNGSELSSGTYFYKIEFSSGKAPLSGYITLKR